jgi:uncharacterized membrane protein YccC
MNESVEESPRPSLLRRAGAVLILAIAAFLLLKVILHVIMGVVWIVVAVVAVVGIFWAIRQL